MLTQFSSKAYAKINLGLKITGRLSNGYHTLHSLFLEIDLFDHLRFELRSGPDIIVTTEGIQIQDRGINLCEKAARILQQTYGVSKGVHINLDKKIPIGAGLGGGSSDAGYTLKALSKLWNLKLTDKKLIEHASRVGADVPFFIRGGLQLAENTGDQLTPVDDTVLQSYHFVLVKPDFEISTPWAYEQIKKYLKLPTNIHKFAPLSDPLKWELFENDFERVIVSTYPELAEIKANLLSRNAVFASLSGSGSTVYGIFDDREKASLTAAYFSSQSYWTACTRPVQHKQ
ncbi:MAG: 4-(cytidine 5'-diphospho)-2-C-methyl-D-erythritol kinase [Fidelibacterota bacterium]